MREENGIQMFEEGELPAFPEGLDTDFNVLSRFGFKVVEDDGQSIWEAATEADFRRVVGQLLGILPSEVEIEEDKGNGTRSCRSKGVGCNNGDCSGTAKCGGPKWDAVGQVIFCYCR